MNLVNFIAPLFVPADRPERFEKAALSGADTIIIDLEDAVAPEAKLKARQNLRVDFTNFPVPLLVRINATGTQWHEDDLAFVEKLPFAGIVLPKAEMGQALNRVAGCGLAVAALIETAQGIADARCIAALPAVKRLIFGSIDFCVDLGCAHTRDALLLARCELILASRLGKLAAPIDGVTTAIDDAELIASDARYAQALGFGGKLAIHPKQIAAIYQGFRPEASEIAWAHKVLASGAGAVTVDGAMVDQPVRLRAQAILQRAAK